MTDGNRTQSKRASVRLGTVVLNYAAPNASRIGAVKTNLSSPLVGLARWYTQIENKK